ncbi:unnamed protein product [Cunninghamella blakesleeana]
MTSGLSSILDLIDLNEDAQASLFNNNEWDTLKKKFMNMYLKKPVELSSFILDTWSIIVNTAKLENGVNKARQYISKLLIPNSDVKYIKVIDDMLNVFEKQNKLSDKKIRRRMTEYDYIVKIWAPLIESVLSINNLVRLKVGESINSITTDNKQLLYDDANIHGFKVDLRFVFDGDDDEYDLAAGEVAKNNNDDKICKDHGKLLREGKDALDGLIKIFLNDHDLKFASSWIIQISGLHGQISSIHLAESGLYVAIPQGKLSFPTSISSLDDLLDAFKTLLLFSINIEKSAHNIRSAIELLENRRLSFGKSFNRSGLLIPSNIRQNWTRPTYYTLPRNVTSLSRIPVNLFVDDDVDKYNEDEDKCSEDEDKYNDDDSNQVTTSTSISNKNKKYDVNTEHKEEADDYGWIKSPYN